MMVDTTKLFRDIVNSKNLESIPVVEVATVVLEILTLLEENNFYIVKEEFD